MGKQNLETRLVESLLVVCLSVFAISNRCSKDSCCAHKGLVTNWPHHNPFLSSVTLISLSKTTMPFGRPLGTFLFRLAENFGMRSLQKMR